MEISSAQKLITLLLCDLLRDKADREIDPDFIAAALTSGQTWAIPAEYPGVDIREDVPAAVVREVQDILSMWRVLETWYSELDPDGKEKVGDLAPSYREAVKFPGFDGNNETDHYSTTKFIAERTSRFFGLLGKTLNSHAPMLGKYRRMLAVYDTVRDDVSISDNATPEEIASVLNA